jgi:hypothetical protein
MLTPAPARVVPAALGLSAAEFLLGHVVSVSIEDPNCPPCSSAQDFGCEPACEPVVERTCEPVVERRVNGRERRSPAVSARGRHGHSRRAPGPVGDRPGGRVIPGESAFWGMLLGCGSRPFDGPAHGPWRHGVRLCMLPGRLGGRGAACVARSHPTSPNAAFLKFAADVRLRRQARPRQAPRSGRCHHPRGSDADRGR